MNPEALYKTGTAEDFSQALKLVPLALNISHDSELAKRLRDPQVKC